MSRFREYVTSTTFHLTLGKTHITALAAVKSGEWGPAHAMGLWVPAIHAIIRRGLVDALPIYDSPDGNYAEGATFLQDNAAKPFSKRYKLSREGEAVWTLLVMAGLVEDVQPKRARRAA